MALGFLLDTNILSELVRHPSGPITDKIRSVGEEAVCTSIVVSSELRFGAAKSGSERLSEQVEAVLAAMEILPLTTPVDHEYAAIRWALEQRGQPIGPNDLLIAAHARSEGLTLVTANLAEFKRVPALNVEDWRG